MNQDNVFTARGALALAITTVLVTASAAAAEPPSRSPTVLDEIVVTVQRRQESLQDVPVAVTALDGDTLEARGITNFASYLQTVPGASLNELGSLANEVKFRGIGVGTAFQSPTTAVYFGEVPVIHTGRNVNSSYNLRAIDLARIEVMRGPQGQLFGANSLGGAIRSIPRAADLESFGVRGNVEGYGTHNGGDSWNADATVNVPLVTGRFAARLTGYTATDAGWYDNVYAGGIPLATLAGAVPRPPPGAPPPPPGSPPPPPFFALPFVLPTLGPAAAAYAAPAVLREDVNELKTDGARLMLGGRLNDAVGIEVALLWERQRQDGDVGAQQISPIPGRIPGTFIVPNTQNPALSFAYPGTSDATRFQQYQAAIGGLRDELRLANVVVTWDAGVGTLTSSTAYWDRRSQFSSDLGNLAWVYTGVAATLPLRATRDDEPQTFIQELRLASNGNGPWRWLGGLYYQQIDQDFELGFVEDSPVQLARSLISRLVPPGTPVPADITRQVASFEDEQVAAFGELGYQFTPAWSAAASFRWFTLDQSADVVENVAQFQNLGPQRRSNSDDVFTPKVNLSYRPTEDQLWYAPAANGFRTGVINLDLPPGPCGRELAAAGFPQGAPSTEPDTVWNYELGAKLEFLDDRVTLNAAAYHIRWNDMQAQVNLNALIPGSACQFPVQLNVGDARSRGLELELAALLTDHLRLDAAFAYTDAEYLTDYPAAGIAKGQAVENVPETQAFVGLQYSRPLLGRDAFARVEVAYVGDKEKKGFDFVSQPQPVELGDYATVNLRLGWRFTDAVAAELWANNLFDEYGVTYAADSGGLTPPTVYTIRPRSVGATLRVSF
jgi:outer membrane receptor protein involved in Fe transport